LDFGDDVEVVDVDFSCDVFAGFVEVDQLDVPADEAGDDLVGDVW